MHIRLCEKFSLFLFSFDQEPMLGGYPCHHGMARPRVADGRDGLQLVVSCEYIE
jgi:hypothetical protein